MLVRLLGMIIQRLGNRFIVAVMVFVAFIAMPVLVHVLVTIGMVSNYMPKRYMKIAGAPDDSDHNKQQNG